MSRNPVYSIFGEDIEILVPSKATNYTFCIGVQTSPPGGGPPPHKHEREEEIFTVLEGEYEFFDGREWVPFRKGQVMYSLRNTFHSFRNCGTTQGKLIFTTNASGLDEYFEAIAGFAVPKDLDRLNEISKYYGYEFMAQKLLGR